MKNAEFAYFLHLLKCGLDGTTPLPVPDNVELCKVFDIALKQKTEVAVYEAAIRLKEDISVSVKEKYSKIYEDDLRESRLQAEEYEKIEKCFESKKIDFMPLKGIYLNRLYSEPHLRQAESIDIYYEVENRETAKSALEESGYKTVSWNSVPSAKDIFAKDDVCVMLNRRFIYSERLWDAYFASVFSNSIPSDKVSGEYFMNDETACVFALMNAAKQFKSADFGIRPLIDLYILLKKRAPSRDAVIFISKNYGLSKFASLLFDAVDAWFLGGIGTEKTDLLAEFIRMGKGFLGDQRLELDGDGESENFLKQEKHSFKQILSCRSKYRRTKKNSEFYKKIEQIAGISLS